MKIIVYIKAPRPGQVKTRLARDIGTAAAADAYRVMVDALLPSLPETGDVELHYTPVDGWEDIRPWLKPGWRARPQHGETLGDRLRVSFRIGFQTAAKVAIIGSDCPWIRPSDFDAASDALDRDDLVLGPARDGGYWLIALARECPALFDAIEWGGPRVLKQTLRQAEAERLSVALLHESSDIDTLEDWLLAKQRL